MSIILSVKQGEELSVPFTIYADSLALDISGAVITVEVKRAPYITTPPLFTKTITQTSDIDVDGQITSPTTGEFQIKLLETDTSYPPMDYYLVITMDRNNSKDIISSDACDNAIYRICTQ